MDNCDADDSRAKELAAFRRKLLDGDYESPALLKFYNEFVPPTSGYSILEPETIQRTEGPLEPRSEGCSAVDPPGIENWPRRLLQLTSPVWTSHEWQPGHIYGGHRKPKYNAISYTWGRFRLDSAEGLEKVRESKELEQVKSLAINGCPWNIPPIDPTRFTVEEFINAVERTAEIDGDSTGKFVWLDVACIDQDPTSEAGQLEVGRQADIFKGAQDVSVWLTDFNLLQLEDAFASIRLSFQGKLATKLELDEAKDGLWKMEDELKVFNTMADTLSEICSDPWFTSLWTLQEAFLCLKARFLSRDGYFVRGNAAGLQLLSHLALICERSRVIVEHLRWIFREGGLRGPTWWKISSEIERLVKSSGLAALHSKNPLALYGIAGKRTTTKEEDRIYAIQQVFGFRLGSSMSGYAGRVYSRMELQTQLGAELLKKYPVQSQMHIFDEPAEDQRGWCISSASRLPEQLSPQNVTRRASLRAYPLDLGGCVGFFNGQTCTFADFCDAAERADEFEGEKTRFTIHLDASRTQLGESPPHHRRGTRRHEDRDVLASWLNKVYSGQNLHVLLLGAIEGGFIGYGAYMAHKGNVGLLLAQTTGTIDGYTCWKRIGFAAWDSTLHYWVDVWEDGVEGLFG